MERQLNYVHRDVRTSGLKREEFFGGAKFTKSALSWGSILEFLYEIRVHVGDLFSSPYEPQASSNYASSLYCLFLYLSCRSCVHFENERAKRARMVDNVNSYCHNLTSSPASSSSSGTATNSDTGTSVHLISFVP
ncbi:hypothetical protein M5689_022819 [Euphorbia peplus]|nr:hypothetical protein M5689_022819 [Euphorbia peplus]